LIAARTVGIMLVGRMTRLDPRTPLGGFSWPDRWTA